MRPLELTLSGLHSYRESVTIDFTELGRFGLFGIFGPIGSGKSTLLDGITLALFGLVDRIAGRSRKGLIHTHAQKCEVRFRFLLPSARGSEIYEVHRAYKNVDGIAQRIGSRVVHASDRKDQSVVLAEKETDVNRVLLELIGLSADDFMRAVVLPQGRFIQLLHLKGQERRQMLQRIFHLQAYGEDLRRQVRFEQDTARTALAAAGGELVGLGDASPQAIGEAKEAADAAHTTLEGAELAHARARTAHAAGHASREQAEKVAAADAQLATHLAGDGGHTARVATLEAARRLMPLRVPAQALLAAHARASAAAQRAAQARSEAAQAQADSEAAQQLAAASGQAWAEEETPLRDTIGRLERAQGHWADRCEEADRASAATTEANTAEGTATDRLQALATLRTERGTFESERKLARRELHKARITPAERERVGKATQAALVLAAAQRGHAGALAQEQGAASVLEQAQARRARAAEAVKATAEGVAAASEALAAAAAHEDLLSEDARAALNGEVAAFDRALAADAVHEAHRQAVLQALSAATFRQRAAVTSLAEAGQAQQQAAEILRGAERALTEAEGVLDGARVQVAAADLAKRLKPGEPCSVCGGLDHPRPAESVAAPLPEAPVVAHRTGHHRAVQRHEAAVGRHATATAVLAAATTAESEAKAQLAVVEEAMVSAASREDLAAVRERLDADGAAQRAVATLQAAVVAAQGTADRAALPAASAEATVEAAKATLAQAAAESSRWSEEVNDSWAAFHDTCGGLTLFDVPSAAAALEARDQSTATLNERLERLDTSLATLAVRESEAQVEQQAAAAAATRCQERAVESERRIAVLDKALAAADPGGEGPAIGARLDAARSNLALRLEAKTAAETQLRVATMRFAPLERALADALAHAGAADAAQSEAVAGWQQAASVAAPEWAGLDADEVAARLRDLPDEGSLAVLQAEVTAWERTRLALEARRQALEQADSAEPTDLPPWETLVADLQAATTALDAARTALTLAERHRDDLLDKVDRHRQLSTETRGLDTRLGRLSELTHLLRGDRFVEFVANDHLADLTERASVTLQDLTLGRYRLGLDSEQSFQIVDEDVGGTTRPVTSLSGGESFLAALALALALSAQVQERSLRPLGFFFLDEGFGTLDAQATDRVMSAIERLSDGERLIGLISHVPTIRDRVPRYLWVTPATATHGSTVAVRDN